MSVTADEMPRALAAIARWRSDPEMTVPCPRCGADGLAIADRSARPYAEWYHLSCPGCGLDETVHIPLGPPVMGGLD